MKTLLLHSCCAPCSGSVIEKLAGSFDITVFYYNPNIMPNEEYEKRKEEQKRLLNILGIKFIEGDYDNKDFKKAISGLETLGEGSRRCYECYKFRLKKTFETANKLGFNYFDTTLSVSPHKKSGWILEIGKNLTNEVCIYLSGDYKKQDGYKRSIELSKRYGLYRQHYCGCGLDKE